MIDTHAHLDACGDRPSAIVRRARAAGVERILTVGTTPDDCRKALGHADTLEGVWAILGIHPHEAGGADEQALRELRELLAHERAVAVGETGLDFYRDYAPRDRQLALFEAELELAADLGKPVVIHTRSAPQETMRALESFDGTVVMHCFSSPDLLPVVLERGYYLSFAGNVTYPKARELREAAVEVPPDRLLTETDSPYLTPQAKRGRPNEPAYVAHTLEALAETRGEDPGELEAQIDANANEAFSLP